MAGVVETADRRLVVLAQSRSGVSGSKTSPNLGGGDVWLICLDEDGRELWQRTYGTADDDVPYGMRGFPDGGVVVVGFTRNATNSAAAPQSAWIMRVDRSGNELWKEIVDGSGKDIATDVELTSDWGFIVSGISDSPPSGTKTSPAYGGSDAWLLRFGPEGPMLSIAPMTSEVQISLRGPVGTFVTEHSPDFVQWKPLSTNTIVNAGDSVTITNRGATNEIARFYRARWSQ